MWLTRVTTTKTTRLGIFKVSQACPQGRHRHLALLWMNLNDDIGDRAEGGGATRRKGGKEGEREGEAVEGGEGVTGGVW